MRMNKESQRRWQKILVLLGGVPLLGVMLVDTVAVAGRHLRAPLNGSIELVQGLLVISGATAMLVATIAGVHATVRLLLDRLSDPNRAHFDRVIHVVSALYFFALCAGGVWLAIDMWPGFEQSELLGVPYRPLRMAANLGIAGIAIVLLYRSIKGRSR